MLEPRIFVNIASYRDTECQWTIKSLFEKAKFPDRVFVGICWQFIADEDADCFTFETRPEQCRVIKVDARDSLGACWARSKVQTLWQGEEYTLQIDSHMRFVQDWDEILLAMLKECPSERSVLSTYPPTYVPPDTLGEENIAIMFASEFDQQGILKLHSRALSMKDAPASPAINPFCAAGLLFSSSAIIKEVPYDPYLYFLGEEITLAVRLWTSGWDIYTPNKVVVYHDYTQRPGRRRHWNDNKDWNLINDVAIKRIHHLLEMEEINDAEALKEVDRYGLGRKRTLAQYQDFSKVDFRRRLIDGKTTEEIEMAAPPAVRRKKNSEVFTKNYASNGWGAEETRCGDGSTMKKTETIRAELPKLFSFLGIRSLIDAGCGDLNWMRHISQGLNLYLGYDIIEPQIEEARKLVADRPNHLFALADISLDTLPQADAILCRDVLTHLPHWMAKEALARFKASRSAHLIATTFQNGKNDRVFVGGWQPVDLTVPPFFLPPPFMTISEGLAGTSKSLGVWRLEDLP